MYKSRLRLARDYFFSQPSQTQNAKTPGAGGFRFPPLAEDWLRPWHGRPRAHAGRTHFFFGGGLTHVETLPASGTYHGGVPFQGEPNARCVFFVPRYARLFAFGLLWFCLCVCVCCVVLLLENQLLLLSNNRLIWESSCSVAPEAMFICSLAPSKSMNFVAHWPRPQTDGSLLLPVGLATVRPP